MSSVGKPGIYTQGYQDSVSPLLAALGEFSGGAPIYLNRHMTEPYRFSLLKNSSVRGFSGGVVSLRKK